MDVFSFQVWVDSERKLAYKRKKVQLSYVSFILQYNRLFWVLKIRYLTLTVETAVVLLHSFKVPTHWHSLLPF